MARVSSTSCPPLSNRKASLAGTSGAVLRVLSRKSRALVSSRISSKITLIPLSFSCLYLLTARSSGLAVRNILSRASGKTTVPMSRPSATRPGARRWRRCQVSSAVRTSGKVASFEAALPHSSVRRRAVTSSSSSQTHSVPDGDTPKFPVDPPGQGCQSRRVIQGDAIPQCRTGEQAIEGATVEVIPAQFPRQLLADGSLAGATRTVDRDHRRAVRQEGVSSMSSGICFSRHRRPMPAEAVNAGPARSEARRRQPAPQNPERRCSRWSQSRISIVPVARSAAMAKAMAMR